MNLVLDQLIIPYWIFISIPITYLFDIVLILQREILSWTPMGIKGSGQETDFLMISRITDQIG